MSGRGVLKYWSVGIQVGSQRAGHVWLLALGILLGVAVARQSSAQGYNWVPTGTSSILGVDGVVFAIVQWDPDGEGPSPQQTVVGGRFTVAGSTLASNLAMWDGVAWLPLGGGTNAPVNALAIAANGTLLVGGEFTCVGGVNANYVARWDGSVWTPLGFGLCDKVFALAALPNGDVIAGCEYNPTMCPSLVSIARWDGQSWSALGTGVNGTITALAMLPNGDIVAGGSFDTAGGVPANNIAKWNGAIWEPLGAGVSGGMPPSPGGVVYALAVRPNGTLVVGGSFAVAGVTTANGIASWDGNGWVPFGVGMGGIQPTVFTLAALPNGDIIAGGSFETAGGVSARRVARWNGLAWLPFGSGTNSIVLALAPSSGSNVVAGGFFTTAGSLEVRNIAHWNGTAWQVMGMARGFNSHVYSLLTLSSGDVVAGGAFTLAGGVAARYVARWNHDAWLPLGSGTSFTVLGLTETHAGAIVVGGDFSQAGGTSANRIAQWDGTQWMSLGTGMNDTVIALATLPSGDIVAGGHFTNAGGVNTNYIAAWDGSVWRSLGAGIGGPPYNQSFRGVHSLAVLSNDDLVVGGYFTSAGSIGANFIARWNGHAWSPLGSGMGGMSPHLVHVRAILPLPNGELIAGGRFDTAGGIPAKNIARWNGATWEPLGAGLNSRVYALARLENGDIVAGGLFDSIAGIAGTKYIARWNGTAWLPFGSGMDGGGVEALAAFAENQFIAGGRFSIVGGLLSPHIAHWGPTPFNPPDPLPAGQKPAAVAIANFDGDALGRPDLAVANAASGAVTLLFNTGVPGSTPSFSRPSAAFTVAVGAEPRSIATADFNRDGKPDLAVANASDNSISVLLGMGDGHFTPEPTIATLARPIHVSARDLNHDDKADLIVACESGGQALVFRNTSPAGGASASFQPAATLHYAGGSRPTSTGEGDLEGDKDDDVVVTDATLGIVAVFFNQGNFAFSQAQVFDVASCGASEPRDVALADVDNDGALDVVVADRGANSVVILRNRGVSAADAWLGLEQAASLPTGGLPSSIVSGDFYGLGRADLVTANAENTTTGEGTQGSISLLHNVSTTPGQILFEPESRILVPPDAGFVTSDDINLDTHLDLVLANSILAGADSSSIAQQLSQAPHRVARATDGTDDGVVTVLANRTAAPVLAPCNGDANGDRVCDFLDLNIVLGTYGQIAPALPGDLNIDGTVDFLDLNIVLGAYGAGC